MRGELGCVIKRCGGAVVLFQSDAIKAENVMRLYAMDATSRDQGQFSHAPATGTPPPSNFQENTGSDSDREGRRRG